MTEADSQYGRHIPECDREPIHVPGAIQPHGMLFVVEPESARIVQASANIGAQLGFDNVLGRPLSHVLGAASNETLMGALHVESLDELNPIGLHAGGRRFDGILHRSDGAMIVELEPLDDDQPPLGRHALRRALMAMRAITTLADLEERVIVEVMRLTDFDRVMLYRFDDEGYGHVSAEVKRPGLDSYFGVHYPASDIPRQARALYTRNWLRIIPDSSYEPVPIVPALRPDTNVPLDLSSAVLRSVSPVHREYLCNMGVTASMSASLVVRGQLWGLISCTNHSGPRRVRYEVRSTCEVLARLVSLQIEALEEREMASARGARRESEEALVAAMRQAEDNRDVLERLLSRPEELMALTRATGVAVTAVDRCTTCGEVPSDAFVRQLSGWLDREGAGSVFESSCLPLRFPDAHEYKDVASGLLMIELPGAAPRRLFWFRPERVRTVSWGGDPRKPLENDAADGRPHPRRSFEIWKDEVRERSLPWISSDIEAASSLRRHAVEIDLELQVVRERRAVRLRDDVMAVLSHDLRGPLSVVDMQATMLLQTAGGEEIGVSTLQGAAQRIKRSVDRMNALISNLLDVARIEAGELSLDLKPETPSALLEEALLTLAPLAEAKEIAIHREVQQAPEICVDRERFLQVLANLIGNAVKFAPRGGTITVRAARAGNEIAFSVSDTGPGIAPEHLPHLFRRYWRAGSEGVGLGLFVVKGIVESHGGRVSALSSPGEGATFTFTVPSASC